jgi:hypothetical protein
LLAIGADETNFVCGNLMIDPLFFFQSDCFISLKIQKSHAFTQAVSGKIHG